MDNEEKKLIIKEKVKEIFEQETRPLSKTEFDAQLKKAGLNDFNYMDLRDYNVIKIYFVKNVSRWNKYKKTDETFLKEIISFYYPFDKFVAFIRQAIKNVFEDISSISLSDLVDKITNNIINFFGLNTIFTELLQEGIFLILTEDYIRTWPQFILRLYDDFLVLYVIDHEIEALFNKKFNGAFIIDNYNYQGKEYYFKLKSALPSPQIIIKDGIEKILKNANKGLTMDKLHFKINLLTDIIGIKKPVPTSFIKNVINMNKDLFVYDEINDNVRLITDEEFIEYAKEYLVKNTTLISSLPEKFEEDGIIALTYIGNYFPLEEAAEYVKVRPLIFLTNVSEGSNIEDYLDIEKMDVENPKELDFRYLKVIISNENNPFEWIKENLSISYLKCSKERSKISTPKLIKAFSPIFNFNHNPGNLFESIIKAKMKLNPGVEKPDSLTT